MSKPQELSTLKYIAHYQIPDSKVTSRDTSDHVNKGDHMIKVSGLVSRSRDLASEIISGSHPVLPAFQAKSLRIIFQLIHCEPASISVLGTETGHSRLSSLVAVYLFIYFYYCVNLI